MNFDSIQGKKILITGHTGFKGTWLSNILMMLGAKVFGISSPEHNFPFYELSAPVEVRNSYKVDIRDFDLLKKTILRIEPDLTFHLAAQPLVRESYSFPYKTFSTNTLGTANLLEVLRSVPNNLVSVMVTTDKVYKNEKSPAGYAETSSLGGLDPYSASKSAAEHVISGYRSVSQYDKVSTSIVAARSGNVIGGGDFAKDRLLPDLIAGFESGQLVKIRNPNSLRPWQHVLDPLFGYISIAIKGLEGSLQHTEFNFGPGEKSRLKVEEIVRIATNKWPWPTTVEFLKESIDAPIETELLWLDSSRARETLDWHCYLEAEQAIEWTIEWALRSKLENPGTITRNQISRYMEEFL